MSFALSRTITLSAFVGMALAGVAGCTMSDVSDEEVAETDDAELRRRSCYSSSDCRSGEYCTTEDGVCNSPCAPGQVCIQVCAGTCKRDRRPSKDPGETCGSVTCAAGEVCCNSSCGICTPPGGFCTQQFCAVDDASR